jgi:hypothetical protein
MADADLLFLYRRIMLWTLVRRTRRLAGGRVMVLRNLVAVIGRGLVELGARRKLDHDEMVCYAVHLPHYSSIGTKWRFNIDIIERPFR